jgi:hypothetical protein
MLAPKNVSIEERLDRLELGFPQYLQAFNTNPPFKSRQLDCHRRTIELLRTFASAADAVRDESFAESLAATLEAWDVGVERHGQSLVPQAEFRRQLKKQSLAVGELECLRIGDDALMDDERVSSLIWHIIDDLDIVRCKDHPVKRKVVSGTKALHHLLPNLVPPMDNEYTATFFGLNGFGDRPEQGFRLVFRSVAATARVVSPQSYVGQGWNSSVSKVLDNAIVGFCRTEGLLSRNKGRKKEGDALIGALRDSPELMEQLKSAESQPQS